MEQNTSPTKSIETALLTLAGRCNYAATKDGMGFNKLDTSFGHSLADQIDRKPLSAKQYAAALRMLAKYGQQLAGCDIHLPTHAELTATLAALETTEPARPALPPATVSITRSNGNLTITFSRYDAGLVALVKSLPERRYNPTDHTWRVPTRFARDLLALYPDAIIDDATQALAEQHAELSQMSNKASTDYQVPGLKGQLYPFQRAGVEFLERANGRAIIGDEMGLGKTVQAAAWLHLHPECRPAVIVVPASLKENWRRELIRWIAEPGRIICLEGRTPAIVRADILIINYDILPYWQPTLSIMRPAAVIADEAHMAKNPKAARSKALAALAKTTKHFIPLTGTPVLNRPQELFSLLNLVDSTAWPSFWRFAKKYCAPSHNGFGWDFNGASDLEDLYQRTRPYILRRTKKDVLTELPAKRRANIVITMDEKGKAAYQKRLSEVQQHLTGMHGPVKLSVEHISEIEGLKQDAVMAKLGAAVDWIRDFIEVEKLVVFCWHTAVADRLMQVFKGQAVQLTGSTPAADRQKVVDRFQTDETCRLFVGNIKAAGVGITLTAASNVAFLELGWTPADMSQAEDRVHRIGQTESVTAWYLLAAGTIEEDIAELLEAKAEVVDAVTDGKSGELRFGIANQLAAIISRKAA